VTLIGVSVPAPSLIPPPATLVRNHRSR
jgi:hypothetical protein